MRFAKYLSTIRVDKKNTLLSNRNTFYHLYFQGNKTGCNVKRLASFRFFFFYCCISFLQVQPYIDEVLDKFRRIVKIIQLRWNSLTRSTTRISKEKSGGTSKRSHTELRTPVNKTCLFFFLNCTITLRLPTPTYIRVHPLTRGPPRNPF